ncbi:nucleotidyltransferase family protein [Frigoriflavimonas asaccharolytica]|uniref:Polymerase beta nucleotidyltransferase domain-containing protein n=1 Tax=Frigoriflavimonas asaccharolytica TaxID=2735899 RepID=A0A8J8G741_9FLAO|nr:nucleotidyltransferase domain-containing protein [Frigoriflavimonas asaccharolytica]NRS92211.1 hypothetical protein [Frigoriflavimonas asaccharolytica]
MNLRDAINTKMAEFLLLCENHNVKSLYAFGSSITPNFDESKSDIDLMIEISDEDPLQHGEKLMSIWDKFELFFERKVDLLTYKSIKNPILKKNIDATKILIYDGQDYKIS